MSKIYVKNSIAVLKKVLMCAPTFLEVEPINEISNKWKDTILDVKKMELEHETLVNAYNENGVEVILVDAHPRRGDSVFSRDFGGCVREGYILGRFKEPVRQSERVVFKHKMRELGIPLLAECTEGFFEGGDFFFLDDSTIVIGKVARSDEKGVEEVRGALEKYGYKVIGVPCNEEYLHLDLCFNMVDEKLAVAYRQGLPKDFLTLIDDMGIETINISEKQVFDHGCNVQSLGNKRVISLKKNTGINEELRQKGIKVIEVDITEILKAGGGPHCMTFPLERI